MLRIKGELGVKAEKSSRTFVTGGWKANASEDLSR